MEAFRYKYLYGMLRHLANTKTDIWPKNRITYYIETMAIILMVMISMFLEYGEFDYSILLNIQFLVRILGSLFIWFINRFALEYILQSRVDSNKVTQFLPFELTVTSIAITSIVYIIFYPILIYLNNWNFQLINFFKGLFVTIGFCLLIVIFYAVNHIWISYWSDGEFLFKSKKDKTTENERQNFIPIKNSKGIINYDIKNIAYFISESKIVFLIDTSGKKWVTQYNLSELEESIGNKFFRLNRRILVSRHVISQIKKLSNHRLLVTISHSNESHEETVSRYKSTRFKQWLDRTQEFK